MHKVFVYARAKDLFYQLYVCGHSKTLLPYTYAYTYIKNKIKKELGITITRMEACHRLRKTKQADLVVLATQYLIERGRLYESFEDSGIKKAAQDIVESIIKNEQRSKRQNKTRVVKNPSKAADPTNRAREKATKKP